MKHKLKHSKTEPTKPPAPHNRLPIALALNGLITLLFGFGIYSLAPSPHRLPMGLQSPDEIFAVLAETAELGSKGRLTAKNVLPTIRQRALRSSIKRRQYALFARAADERAYSYTGLRFSESELDVKQVVLQTLFNDHEPSTKFVLSELYDLAPSKTSLPPGVSDLTKFGAPSHQN